MNQFIVLIVLFYHFFCFCFFKIPWTHCSSPHYIFSFFFFFNFVSANNSQNLTSMTKLRFLEQSSVLRKAHTPHCCRFKFRLEISAHAQNIVPVCDVGCAEPPAQFFPLTCQEMKSLHTITYSFILTVTSQNIPDVGTASPPSPKWSNRDKMALAL